MSWRVVHGTAKGLLASHSARRFVVASHLMDGEQLAIEVNLEDRVKWSGVALVAERLVVVNGLELRLSCSVVDYYESN